MGAVSDCQIIVDVSRSLSRLHLPNPTGIDRVEQAYIRHVSEHHSEALAVGRMGKDYLLAPLRKFSTLTHFDSAQQVVKGSDRFRYKLSPEQRRTKTLIRGRFGWIGRSRFLSRLKSMCATDARIYSVGHSRALTKLFPDFKAMGCDISVMIHDIIPMTHPNLVRSGTLARFESFLMSSFQYADQLIAVSNTTATEISERFNIDTITVARPGIEPMQRRHTTKVIKPYVLCVGTLEPRKNLSLLLDIWSEPEANLPKLVLVGQKGWESDLFFNRLFDLVGKGCVEHISDASDDDLMDHYSGAEAVLFPSLAEGFGLPFYEAAAFGHPVLASDIPAFQEAVDDPQKLIDPRCPDAWRTALQAIEKFRINVEIPTWDDHFKQVGL